MVLKCVVKKKGGFTEGCVVSDWYVAFSSVKKVSMVFLGEVEFF